MAGIILVLGFVATAFAVSQVANIQSQASQEQDSSYLTEFQFIRAKFGTILSANTGPTTDNTSFQAIFNTTALSFTNSIDSRGYDASIQLASNATNAPQAECTFLTHPCPATGTSAWNGETGSGTLAALTQPYDGKSDGIVWMCGKTGEIVGTVVFFYINDGSSTISETVIYGLNQAWYASQMSLPLASRCQ
ncbi:MAG: hypothetical protein ACYDDF_01965 [Thermoplasmatota archaeon]